MTEQDSKPGSTAARVSPEEQAYVALLRTAYQLERDFALFLKPHELSPTQYNALRILRGAGPKGLACSHIADRMLSQDSDITRLMDRLEKRGLVTRQRGKQDRRIIRAKISAKGHSLLRGLDHSVSQYVKRRMEALGERLVEFRAMLEDIGKNRVARAE
jgi:DNA-binding MarR family transcriptional regulator